MNLQKLVSSQASYTKFKQKTLQTIKNDPQKQNTLRNIILFCKQVFSTNTNARKKYLCLLLIRDIFENVNTEYYQKLVDQYLALKIFQMLQIYIETNQSNKQKQKQKKVIGQDRQIIQKVYWLSIQTIIFWAKRLAYLQKSIFSQVYNQLKKMKIELLNQFKYYKKQMLLQLWKNQQIDFSNSKEHSNPIIIQLDIKFKKCKQQIQKSINQSLLTDQQVNTKSIIQSLRDYLLLFYSNYRELEVQQSNQRDIVIVYFHVLNNLYKKICNQIHMSIQEIISITKEIFQAVYPSEYDSVDRMDMIQLAGVFKYNALTVFQRIHQRIEKQDAKLGPFKLNISLQQNQRPPLPSGMQASLSLSRAASNQRFIRTNNNNA